MSVVTTTLPPKAGYTNEPIYRLTVDQYHDLIDRGKLTADDPVELIEGMLVFKMPKNPPHEITIGLITDVVTALLSRAWHLRTQASITLNDGEPEPDGAIVRGQRRDYTTRHPGPEDIALLIEVSDSTLDRDRGIKLRSYARAGIGCYWIVNLVDRQVEVYSNPGLTAQVPHYGQTTIFKAGGVIQLFLDGQPSGQIAVTDILPVA